jgi:uncharacterized membrane protein
MLLSVFIFYLFIAGLIAFIIAFKKLKKLEEKINLLEQFVTSSEDFKVTQEKVQTETPKKDSGFHEIVQEKLISTEFSLSKRDENLNYTEPVFLRQKTKEKSNFENFFAGNILNKIGAIALILGLGFFLKYAFDNNWLNAFTQVLIGYLVSIGLLVGGNKIEKNSTFSQGLLGTGCASLYLTTYAGYSFYNIIPSGFALILMSAITILSIIIAMNYNSLAIASLGLFGGYVTPLLMGVSGNLVGFLSYLVFLNIISAFTFYKKDWSSIQSFALFANIFSILYTGMFQFKEHQVITIILITLIWVIHFIADILKNKDKGISVMNRVLNPLFFYFLINMILVNDFSSGIVAILLSVAYISTVFLKDFKGYQQNVILGLIFAMHSISIFTDGFATIAYWIVLSVGILLVGAKKEQSYLLNTGVSFLALIFINLLFIENGLVYTKIETYIPLLTPRSLCFSFLIVVSFVSSYFLDKLKTNKGFAVSTLQFLGATALLTLLSVEINDCSRMYLKSYGQDYSSLVNAYKNLTYIITWTLYSICFIKKSNDIKMFKFFGYGAYVLALLMLLSNGFEALPSAIAILNLRVITWLIVMGATALIAKWNKNIRNIFTSVTLFLGFFLIYSEVGIFLPEMSLKQLILSLGWLIYAIVLLSTGIWKQLKVFRYFAIGIISLVILKIFLFDLTFLGQLHRIISFIGLGGILLFASYLYQRYANYIK